jgi:hypothetical protein
VKNTQQRRKEKNLKAKDHPTSEDDSVSVDSTIPAHVGVLHQRACDISSRTHLTVEAVTKDQPVVKE